VRSFPRTARRRVAALVAASTLSLGALAVPAADAAGHHAGRAGHGGHTKTLKHRQAQAHQQVRHAQRDLDESSSRVRAAQAAVDRAVRRLTAARTHLQAVTARLDAARVRDHEMRQKLAAAEARLADAQAQVADGQQALAQQKQSLTDSVTEIYEQGDPQLLAFADLLRSRSTTDITRQEALNDAIVGRQDQAYDDLRAAEVLLQVREDEVQQARDEVEVQRREAAAHLVTMEGLHREAAVARTKVLGFVTDQRAARARAVAARRQDQQALARAKQRENHIRQLLLAAARRARSSHAGYHGSTHGLLIKPVDGPVTSPYGWRIHPIYHYWGLHDGTDFGVSCGEGMRAVASGTVVSRYWSDVYGNRLYLSLGNINGHNVTAVYNHAEGYRVGVGQHVRQGEIVGYVGSTGWSTGCHLHFTILVDGTAVDPMKWLG
jgi:murein DD-endopeptidase MepM/ murein hydrolase activator NlpD